MSRVRKAAGMVTVGASDSATVGAQKLKAGG